MVFLSLGLPTPAMVACRCPHSCLSAALQGGLPPPCLHPTLSPAGPCAVAESLNTTATQTIKSDLPQQKTTALWGSPVWP